MDERLLTVWRELRTVLPTPKLIIFCALAHTPSDLDESFRRSLAEYVPPESIGPQLRLRFEINDTQQAVREVLAAMQAME